MYLNHINIVKETLEKKREEYIKKTATVIKDSGLLSKEVSKQIVDIDSKRYIKHENTFQLRRSIFTPEKPSKPTSYKAFMKFFKGSDKTLFMTSKKLNLKTPKNLLLSSDNILSPIKKIAQDKSMQNDDQETLFFTPTSKRMSINSPNLNKYTQLPSLINSMENTGIFKDYNDKNKSFFSSYQHPGIRHMLEIYKPFIDKREHLRWHSNDNSRYSDKAIKYNSGYFNLPLLSDLYRNKH